MIKIILIALIGSFYAYIEGQREAYAHHNSTLTKNMHPQYFLQRSLVLLLSVITFKPYVAICIAIGGMSAFSYWHNGAYYTLREKLSPGYEPRKWKGHRDGSALMDIPYTGRAIMVITGYVLIALAIYIDELR